jgi:hypothetical protein
MTNNLRQNRTEVRLLTTDQPGKLSQPVVTYPLKQNQEAVLLLDQKRIPGSCITALKRNMV